LDANVLAAQKWVNSTYAAVPGYNRVTEDGIPGWQTTYGLTRALQHELGITALADNFGPGTLAALSAHGPIGPAETNHNLVSIAQCAGYCKGYDPGGIDGAYGPLAAAMVAALMRDAGLESTIDGKLSPKVFKALLNLDAYDLVQGGSASLRDAQRWLNGRYLNRSAFFVLPCDGLGSRDLLRALIFAVQYEVGLSDTSANGNFGPTTQSRLKALAALRTGATGPWVQLFSAAMTLYPAASRFTGAFDADLAADVRAFQAFCELPENGDGDFSTWASLLISTGDQARPATAVDTVTQVTAARAATLTAAGYSVVGRYLTNVEGSGFDKKLKPGEPADIIAAGLRFFPIFQTYADSASFFTRSQGYADGQAAHDAALGHGIDAGAVIYFAVDYDATPAEVDARIVPYFLGVEAGLRARGRRYPHGVYGARDVCHRVSTEAFAQWTFASGITTGWTGNMAYPLPGNWAFDQISTQNIGIGAGLIEIDKCVWRQRTDPAVGAVGSPATTLEAYLDWVDDLRELAVAYGDGRLVLDYLRAGRYDNWQAEALFGPIDRQFVAHVDAAGLGRVRTYRDPVADVDVSRFGDACLAALRTSSVGRADFGGWGSDLVALYSGWRLDGAGTNGHDYCAARLGRSDVVSGFGAAALVADVDAFHAAAALRAGGDLAGHLRSVSRETRLARFLTGRFGDDPDAATAAAVTVLTSVDDPELAAARGRMLAGPSPVAAEVGDFCQGFAAALVALSEAAR
jgi:peptidoglycan hydrolase-like protein with peptidoglycan-binding domain